MSDYYIQYINHDNLEASAKAPQTAETYLSIHSSEDQPGGWYNEVSSDVLLSTIDTLPPNVNLVTIGIKTLEKLTLGELKLIFEHLLPKMQTFIFISENNRCTGISFEVYFQPNPPKIMDWSHNDLTFVPTKVLNKLVQALSPQITELSLRGCNLSNIPLKRLDSFLKALPPHLLALDLAGNNLYALGALIIPLTALLGDNLERLDLSYNFLSSVPFSYLIRIPNALPKQLIQLNLMGNYLCNLSGGELANFFEILRKQIKMLILKDNQFAELPIPYTYHLWRNLYRESLTLDIESYFLNNVLQGHVQAINDSQPSDFLTPTLCSPFYFNNCLLSLMLYYLRNFDFLNKELAYLTTGLLISGAIMLLEAPSESWANSKELRMHEVLRLYSLVASAPTYRASANLLLWEMKTDPDLPVSLKSRMASFAVPPPAANLQYQFPQLARRTTAAFFTPLTKELPKFSQKPNDELLQDNDDTISFFRWIKPRRKLALMAPAPSTSTPINL
ncbi:MAG: hypothetical protein EPN84_02960 [Legionella sp.]|nr:MAG: hypothetical protein EPN84_02960 [Legionella sp.]